MSVASARAQPACPWAPRPPNGLEVIMNARLRFAPSLQRCVPAPSKWIARMGTQSRVTADEGDLVPDSKAGLESTRHALP